MTRCAHCGGGMFDKGIDGDWYCVLCGRPVRAVPPREQEPPRKPGQKARGGKWG